MVNEQKWWIKQSDMPLGGYKVKCDKNTYGQVPTLEIAISFVKKFSKSNEVEVQYADGTVKVLPLK